MPKTLLQIVNQTQAELGLPQTSPIVGNNDPSTVQLYNLLIGLTSELRRMKLWPACQWEMIIEVPPAFVFTGDTAANSNQIININPPLAVLNGLVTSNPPQMFVADVPSIPTECRVAGFDQVNNILTLNMVTTADQTQATFQLAQDTFPFPADFDYFQNRTMWDRTNRWELLGPDSPQMDQWHRSGIVVTGPRRHFRKLGPYGNKQFRIWPSPLELVTNMQLVFEYQSLNCVAVAGDSSDSSPTFAINFTTDADTPLLDDDLLIKGLKWKFWEIKGFNYAALKNDWLDYVDEIFARDGARKTLNLVKRVNPIFISPSTIQDGFFPSPSNPPGV